MLKRLNVKIVLSVMPILLSACVSIESINQSIKPADAWTSQEYEKSTSDRVRVTKAVPREVLEAARAALSELGMAEESVTDTYLVATGTPTTMFNPKDCETWAQADNPKMKDLSGGVLAISCDPAKAKHQLITATLGVKPLATGTFIAIDYNLRSPMYEGYGLKIPKRPPPVASKAGVIKFWAALGGKLSQPLEIPSKEDLR